MFERLHALPVIQSQRWRSQLPLLQAVGRASAVDNGDMYLPGDENRCGLPAGRFVPVLGCWCARGSRDRVLLQEGVVGKEKWSTRVTSRSLPGPQTDPLETGVTSLERKFD